MFDDFEDDEMDDDLNDDAFDLDGALLKFDLLASDSSVYFSEDEIESLFMHFLFNGEADKQQTIIEHGLYLYPNKVEFLLEKASIFVNNNQYIEALEVLHKAKGYEPYNPEILKQEGEVLTDLNHFDEAEKCFKSALKLAQFTDDFQQVEIYKSYADLMCSKNDLKKAISILETGISKIKECEPLYGQIIHNYLAFGDLNDAEVFFKKRIDEHPYSSLDWMALGKVSEMNKKKTQAKSAFEYALLVDPNAKDAHFHMAGILEEEKDYIQAIEHYSSSFKSTDDHYPNICIARCYLAIDNGELARHHLTISEEFLDFIPEFDYLLGYSYLVDKQPKKALPYFLKSLDNDSEDIAAIKGIMVCYFELNDNEAIRSLYIDYKNQNQVFLIDNWKEFLSIFHASEMDDLFHDMVDFMTDRLDFSQEINNIYDVINYDKQPSGTNKHTIIENLIHNFDETMENVKLFCPTLYHDDKEFKDAVELYKHNQDE